MSVKEIIDPQSSPEGYDGQAWVPEEPVDVDIVCFDMDSTLIHAEGIDEMAKYAGVFEEVDNLTSKIVVGEIKFLPGMRHRLGLILPSEQLMADVGCHLLDYVMPGAAEVVKFYKDLGKQVFVVTGSFKRLAIPVAESLGIPAENVYANEIFFSIDGEYDGFDEENLSAQNEAKKFIIENIKSRFPGKKVALVGDGTNDVKAKPVLDVFVGFGAVLDRPEIREHSDYYVYNWEQVKLCLK